MSSSFFLMFFGMSGIFLVLGILYIVIRLMNYLFLPHSTSQKDNH